MSRRNNANPPSIEELLQRAATKLDAAANDRSLPLPVQRTAPWYAAFLREMTQVPVICQTLARLDFSGADATRASNQELLDLFAAVPFPTGPLGQSLEWRVLFEAVVQQDLETFYVLLRRPSGRALEVHISYSGTTDERAANTWEFPILEAIDWVQIPKRITASGLERDLRIGLRDRLKRLRSRADKLMVEGATAADRPLRVLDVRVFVSVGLAPEAVQGRSPLEGLRAAVEELARQGLRDEPPEHLEVLGRFLAMWEPHAQVPTIVNRLGWRIMGIVQERLGLDTGQGKRPDATGHARWWRLHSIEGLTPRQIAEREAPEHEVDTREDTIRRALRQMGLAYRKTTRTLP